MQVLYSGNIAPENKYMAYVGVTEWLYAWCGCKCQIKFWLAVCCLQSNRKYFEIHFLSHNNTPCGHTDVRNSAMLIEIIAVYFKNHSYRQSHSAWQMRSLQLASLYLQQNQLWWSTGYLPYSWYHCTYNSTSSDTVLVTSLTGGITVPTTALALMQYSLLPLQVASLYLQQH